MIEFDQIRIPCGEIPGKQIENQIRHILHLKRSVRFSWTIVRHSVDCRKKPDLYDVYTVNIVFKDISEDEERQIVEQIDTQKLKGHHIRNVQADPYLFPAGKEDAPRLSHRPVVVGFGPCGIFCSLMLAQEGYRPIVLERGQKMEQRLKTVNQFFSDGILNPESNIQFGEGGAGTFSDGKLNSGIRDSQGRTKEVLRILVEAGAPKEILSEQIPHVGTDLLRGIVCTLRNKLCSLGGEIHFESKVTDLILQDGVVKGVRYLDGKEEKELETDVVVLCIGHSARDTMQTLYQEGVLMEPKAFAVGFRVSHPQALIDEARYGIRDPDRKKQLHLPPSSYKLTAKAKDGKGVYSFCMCPGGYVVNASSEVGGLVVNGMSNYKRNSPRANSAIVVTVQEEDCRRELSSNNELSEDKNPFACMRFQQKLERNTFALANGKVPVQRFTSFQKEKVDSSIPSSKELCILGDCAPGALHDLLPRPLTEDFLYGMQKFGHEIKGFTGDECYVIGLESRTSSPVRILRDEQGEAKIKGLYPAGEGAGYAGGILSSAVDGIRAAERIASRYQPKLE